MNILKELKLNLIGEYFLNEAQLNTEKKRVYKKRAKREKQIWVVQENLSLLFDSIKGIAGKSIDSINVLELPDPEFEK
jgi:hypothetical protein